MDFDEVVALVAEVKELTADNLPSVILLRRQKIRKIW